ncbi:MAG: hypothetical protein U0K71_07920 [Paludibacteraceae bacterium]|nr:hypothetical protein [Paludibacteraceae bacterium]
MNYEINALDFISMLVERERLKQEISVPFSRINKLREKLLSKNLPHDLGFYDFEEIKEFYPENVKITSECVRIEMNENFVRIINRRKTKGAVYKKMLELWQE